MEIKQRLDITKQDSDRAQKASEIYKSFQEQVGFKDLPEDLRILIHTALHDYIAGGSFNVNYYFTKPENPVIGQCYYDKTLKSLIAFGPENEWIQLTKARGIRSKEKLNRERVEEISSAIKRYAEAEIKIPMEWVEEYNELIKK